MAPMSHQTMPRVTGSSALADLVNGALSNYINKECSVTVDKGSNLFATLFWFLLFGVSSRYYQIVIQIERQYDYIHHLEELINNKFVGSRAFTREGKAYLEQYPLFSNWIWFLYTIAFPLIVLFSITLRIQMDLTKFDILRFGLVPNFVCYLLVGTSTILYLGRLHGRLILRLLTIPFNGLRKIWQ